MHCTSERSHLTPTPFMLLAVIAVLFFSIGVFTPANAVQLSLSWSDNATNENGYSIERKSSADGVYQSIASVPANNTSYTDTAVQDGVTYCYRVMAYNSAGSSGYSNEGCATATQTSGVVQTASAAPATTQAGSTTAAADPTSSGGSSGGGGGGGGCFIATAAFGSPMAPQVQLLRDFRDRLLLSSAPGQAFVRGYYAVSPPIAEMIGRSDALRAAVRVMLVPVIGWASIALWSPTAGLGLALFPLACGAFLIARCARSR